ncbi:hypothetical protein AG1IA_04833 [Rhizoctonia solani AG-1 IA]|uniref:Uncharacterized protein n=1 Tax=Thanatephorus cucumeris (strain AG1-IA) TaxID=983506 RepID=L8WT23_THACA|nr:hypothetical protein AG1IA_04833 [Rhizoctonia solani AG-1 IA]
MRPGSLTRVLPLLLPKAPVRFANRRRRPPVLLGILFASRYSRTMCMICTDTVFQLGLWTWLAVGAVEMTSRCSLPLRTRTVYLTLPTRLTHSYYCSTTVVSTIFLYFASTSRVFCCLLYASLISVSLSFIFSLDSFVALHSRRTVDPLPLLRTPPCGVPGSATRTILPHLSLRKLIPTPPPRSHRERGLNMNKTRLEILTVSRR